MLLLPMLKFEVPEIMVETASAKWLTKMRMSLESRKMTLEMYMQYTGMDMAKIRENQRATAAENVKTDLVLDAIAKAENIQVSMEDVMLNYLLLLLNMVLRWTK